MEVWIQTVHKLIILVIKKPMKKLLPLLSILLLISCTKEFGDDLFSSDIEDDELLDLGIDPVTGEPIEDEPELEIDPVTGEPIEVDPITGEPIEEEPMEEDPMEEELELDSDNRLIDWSVLINGQNITPQSQQVQGTIIDLIYPFGTDISNVDIILEIPDTATVEGSLTGINFNSLSGNLLLVSIEAENGDTNPVAFDIEVAEE